MYNPYQPYQMPQQQVQIQQQMPQSVITVWSEAEARNYPIAPGVTLTFRNETAPYLYTKSLGLSQFDRPVFEKYHKEQDAQPEQTAQIIDFSEEIKEIRGRLDALEKTRKTTKKEVTESE